MAANESIQVLERTDGDGTLDDLLQHTAAGDQGAFRALYEQSAGRLFAVCLRIVRHRRLAEELLREAYVRIWERARQHDPRAGSALSWMIAIVRDHAIDTIRLRMGEDRPPDDLTLEAAEPSALGAIEAKVEFEAIGRCLREMPYAERHAIILAYRDGLSYEQLAVLLGVSTESVKASVGQGLAQLRTCLDQAS
jgi:RNA polymerase sigma-70 factor (ECF subfamily)